MTPLERVEALFQELVDHYGQGEERELRAAAKLLLVALAKFREHGGDRGLPLVEEYVDLLRQEPDKLARILRAGRNGESSGYFLA